MNTDFEYHEEQKLETKSGAGSGVRAGLPG
jgi:hypothetical protein